MYYLVTIHLVTRGTSRSHATDAYICYMAGRISTDMNGWKKRSVKKFWKELPEDEALPEKASEAEASKLQFVRKLLSMFFFQIRLVDLCRSLQELCVHPVHPVHPTFGAG